METSKPDWRRETAASRIAKPDYRETAITAYIASLTDVYAMVRRGERAREKMEDGDGPGASRSVWRVIKSLAYLRDEYCVESVRGALGLFESGKIDPNVVRRWVREDVLGGDMAMAAIRGYPGCRKWVKQG